MPPRRLLGEILQGLAVLTSRDVDKILEAARRRCPPGKFGQVGRSMGLLSEEEILAALAVQMDLYPGIAALDLPQLFALLQRPDLGGAR